MEDKTKAVPIVEPKIQLKETTTQGVFLNQFGELYSLEFDSRTGQRFLKSHKIA